MTTLARIQARQAVVRADCRRGSTVHCTEEGQTLLALYNLAEAVCVFLGEDTEASEEAMRLAVDDLGRTM